MRVAIGLIGLMLSAVCAAKPSTEVHGVIVHVDDGDTVVLLDGDQKQYKIRLSSIDAPEKNHDKQQKGRIGQPYSEGSARFLASAIKGKTVEAVCFEQDRYERHVCEIFHDGSSVNRAMIANGWAWANVASKGRYLRDKRLLELESRARAERIGIWQGSVSVEPWKWRKDCWQDGYCPQ